MHKNPQEALYAHWRICHHHYTSTSIYLWNLYSATSM